MKHFQDGAYLFEGQEFSLGGRGERVKVVSLKSREGCGGGGYHLISPTTKFTVVESDASPINNQTDIHTDNHKVSMATGGGKLLEWLCRGVGRRGGRNVIRSCLLQGSPGSGWCHILPSFHSSIHSSTHPSFHSSIHPSIHPFILPPIYPFIFSSIHLFNFS